MKPFHSASLVNSITEFNSRTFWRAELNWIKLQQSTKANWAAIKFWLTAAFPAFSLINLISSIHWISIADVSNLNEMRLNESQINFMRIAGMLPSLIIHSCLNRSFINRYSGIQSIFSALSVSIHSVVIIHSNFISFFSCCSFIIKYQPAQTNQS